MSQIDEINSKLNNINVDNTSYRQISEVMYSLYEFLDINVSTDKAIYLYKVVQMVLDGKYTDKMRV